MVRLWYSHFVLKRDVKLRLTNSQMADMAMRLKLKWFGFGMVAEMPQPMTINLLTTDQLRSTVTTRPVQETKIVPNMEISRNDCGLEIHGFFRKYFALIFSWIRYNFCYFWLCMDISPAGCLVVWLFSSLTCPQIPKGFFNRKACWHVIMLQVQQELIRRWDSERKLFTTTSYM